MMTHLCKAVGHLETMTILDSTNHKWYTTEGIVNLLISDCSRCRPVVKLQNLDDRKGGSSGEIEVEVKP